MNILNPQAVETLKDWQTLVGVILGATIGSLMSLFGFYIREKFKNNRNIIEGKRIVEVSSTRTLNDMYDLQIVLGMFLKRTNEIISEINKVMKNDTKYMLEETNFPPLSVFIDDKLPEIRTKSYYVHNKILWTDAGVKRIQAILKEMKQNFWSLSRKNEFLVAAVNAKQREQKETYKSNLEDFNKGIEDVFVPYLKEALKVLMEIKIYNSKMRGKWGFFYKWKFEGISFKYFKNQKMIEKYNQELACIDRIDLIFKKEVDESILDGENKVEEKLKKYV